MSELVLDARDPERLASFWCTVLDWVVVDRYDGQVEIGPGEPAYDGPSMVFVPSTDAKLTKLRLHIDLRPVDIDHASELARILAAGAVRVDIGQGDDVAWAVLADPEGNEFCLLHPHPDHEDGAA